MNEWISVTDRLPTPDKFVLVLARTGGMDVRYFNPGPDGVIGWYPDGLPLENSTHWMELPEPPPGHRENARRLAEAGDEVIRQMYMREIQRL